MKGRRREGEGARRSPSLDIIPLGGIGEIGKNMTAFMYGDDIIIVDAGLMFPREELLGVDYVIPDISFLEKHRDKIRGIFLTHGHEDHIGALPYVIPKLGVPVYGTVLTLALAEARLSEHPDVEYDFIPVKAGQTVKAGRFEVEFLKVSHSIDDAVGLAIKTPIGTVVHTGDFKLDLTPVGGKIMDLNRFAELGKQGVLALLSDSTNAERPGFTMSESEVGETFVNYFRQAKGRIIVASFASNIHRIQQVIDVARIYGRKICLSGRSMINVVASALELGYLKADPDAFVEFDELPKLPDKAVVVLTTGSQGEAMSGLSRMASGEHPKLSIKEGDLVIISASPIPGNERGISDMINLLYRKGASVINDATDMVHVSGHACQEELKLMMTLVKPRYFIPVHGEYRHLYKHAALAEKIGIRPENIFIPETGTVIHVNKKSATQKGTVPSGSVLVDGLGVGDVGNVVLRDRKKLASDGLFIVVVTLSRKGQELVTTPDVVSRGFVYMRESEELMDESRRLVEDIVSGNCRDRSCDQSALKSQIRRELSDFLYEKTNRNPMILPIIIEV
ncbi:MAG: ribonuclease J [Clostridia bacterium]|nr:ribonuclease J [Clostridia bacterium]